MPLFQKSVLNKYLKEQDENEVLNAYQTLKNYFHNPAIQQNILDSKEEQFQEGFLRELFVNVFGYVLNPNPDFNLTTEFKNEKGAQKADGAILKNGKAVGVIELKSTKTKDLETVRKQAFDYKANQTGCTYVVTSNFQKLRFYINDAVEFEEFDLFILTWERFQLLYLCLNSTNLLSDLPLQIKNASIQEEEQITKKFYADYSLFKKELFEDIAERNMGLEGAGKLLLYKKTQKLLDRFLFIFFAEDRGLLPPNSIARMIKRWNVLKDEDAYKPLYEIYKQYFEYLNKGRKGKVPEDDIQEYNGGLFLPDDLLDKIEIDDSILLRHTSALSHYDFESQVDVNILGHIFEHSLNEIESTTAELEGVDFDKQKSKRKKDGVFYTPKYITKYIVDSTVGKLCEEKKIELGIVDEEFTPNRQKETKKRLLAALENYRNWLLELTICDPACGSGAFLNQALEALINEHHFVDELNAKLFGSTMVFQDIENQILEKNLFGVDINEESVEIARLSLWLRTARRGRKLTSLNKNIKCGNSLIDDPEVAGDKAFNWQKEFPKVFEKGGFDVVIGNPPYGILIDKETQAFYNKYFPLTQYKTNLYVLFIERMLQVFEKGIVHFIIPKSLLFNSYYEAIRRELITKTELNEIYTITEKVFEDAEVGSSLLLKFTIKKSPNSKNKVRLAVADKVQNFISGFNIIENLVPQEFFLSIPNCEISVISSNSQSILKKLHNFKPIREYFNLKNGLNPGNIKQILVSDSKESELHKPIIWGKEISRYNIEWGGQFVNYDENIRNKITLDDIKSKEGMNKQNRIDFALRTPDLFENKKIVIRKTGDSLICCLDENNFYFDTLVNGIYKKEDGYELEPLLAILNSKTATKFYRLLHDIKGKVFAKITLDNLGSFPIPENFVSETNRLRINAEFIIEKTKEVEKVRLQFINLLKSKFETKYLSTNLHKWYDLEFSEFLKELKKAKVKLTLSEEAEWMQYFNEQKQKAQTLKAEIDETDREIDQMVYELYGLTEEEIGIVEQN